MTKLKIVGFSLVAILASPLILLAIGIVLFAVLFVGGLFLMIGGWTVFIASLIATFEWLFGIRPWKESYHKAMKKIADSIVKDESYFPY